MGGCPRRHWFHKLRYGSLIVRCSRFGHKGGSLERSSKSLPVMDSFLVCLTIRGWKKWRKSLLEVPRRSMKRMSTLLHRRNLHHLDLSLAVHFPFERRLNISIFKGNPTDDGRLAIIAKCRHTFCEIIHSFRERLENILESISSGTSNMFKGGR